MKPISGFWKTIIGDYPGERQIRLNIIYLYSAVGISLGAALLSSLGIFDILIGMLSALLIFLYGFLICRNDRLEYDEEGIRIYSLLGKAFSIKWSEIERIHVAEEPLIGRSFTSGMVMRIHCKGSKKILEVYRYPLKQYICIEEFVEYAKYRI